MTAVFAYFPPGSAVTIYPTTGQFPASAITGSLAVDASTGDLYEFNGMSWVLIASPSTSGAITGLTGDVTAAGPGVVPGTVHSIGGVVPSTTNTPTTLAERDSSGNLEATAFVADAANNDYLVVNQPGTAYESGWTTFAGVAMEYHNGGGAVIQFMDGKPSVPDVSVQSRLSRWLTLRADGTDATKGVRIALNQYGTQTAAVLTLTDGAYNVLSQFDNTGRLSLGSTVPPAATLDVNGPSWLRSYADLTEISTPSAPASGNLRVYSKAGDAAYIETSGGDEYRLLDASQLGAANGVAPLGAGGKIAVGYLPADVFVYAGQWNPTTNTPLLVDGTGTAGTVYIVSTAAAGPVAGLTNPTMVNFEVGNLIIYNGTQWEQTTPAAGVVSVNGMTGAVTINAINQLTGDVTTTAASGSTAEAATVAKIQGTTVSGTTGSGNVVFSTSPTLVTPVLGTPASGVATNLTGLPLTTGVTGVLPAANGGTGLNATGSSGNVLTSNGAGAWLSLPPAGGAGAVPVGGVVPILSNLTGSYSLPSSGTVDSNGWMRCDGAAIPGGNTVSGTTPNLTSGNFIYGTSGSGTAPNYAAGATGGAGSVTLVAGNIPQVSTSYTPAGTNSSSSIGGSTSTGSTGTGSTGTGTSGSHSHSFTTTPTSLNIGGVAAGGGATGIASLNSTPGLNSATVSIPSLSVPSLSIPSLGLTGTAAAQSFSGSAATITVGSASPTAFAIIPNYVAAVYLMRVK